MEWRAVNGLSEEHIRSLRKGNFHNPADVLLCSPQELTQKCRIPIHDAGRIIDLVYTSADAPQLRRLEDVKDEGSEVWTTGDPILDKVLGGGLRPGLVWEVVGESAAGKTQFALQLALTVQLPREQKGLYGSTCYLTTSSVLPTTRLAQISDTHPLLAASECGLQDVHTISTPTIPILIRVLSEMLPEFIEARSIKSDQKHVKLLVVDALAELFHTSVKTTTTTLVERSKNIAKISSYLHSLASKYRIAILVLNEVVDSFERTYVVHDISDEHDVLYREQSRWFARAHSIPGENYKEASLGLSWANQVNVRIMFSRTGRRRYLDDTEHQHAKRSKSELHPPPGLPISVVNAASTDPSTLIRRLSIIFSSICQSNSLDYIITEAGISILPGGMPTVRQEEATIRTTLPTSDARTSNEHTPQCSQIAPLDIGVSEDRRAAAEEELARDAKEVEPEEDEWDKYWASDEIPADVYNTIDLGEYNSMPAF